MSAAIQWFIFFDLVLALVLYLIRNNVLKNQAVFQGIITIALVISIFAVIFIFYYTSWNTTKQLNIFFVEMNDESFPLKTS